MKNLILITGGARSGKSTLAEKLAKELGKNVVYIATAIPFDEGMIDRIEKHKNSRPKEWVTIERYRDFNELINNKDFIKADTILLDCITLMITNLLLESGLDFDRCSMFDVEKVEKNIIDEIEKLLFIVEKSNKRLIIVTNEVGMGVVPTFRLGNIFRDIAGRVNQYLARRAQDVYLTVSGIPIKIK
ncbi:bifunctional adenosylcobinamide kinase/adenosylcobinamide-phosphate guanylyltransferase [Caloranaerobacter ferrireducens]|uniref:bifunctional adenosylcobinamide kinase/adenosylcobinamide-phosphate guanylyltransferase n=1 Tax=Caloranaerobacter ferrireducens TaxID=1323370 RepID=UPI00084D6DB2|nr:bifunctional adenosylcobinamide kinase/adenosylcobinamide-phosphate guanylyltransferase [Caloranaerobacter ferrireducens]